MINMFFVKSDCSYHSKQINNIFIVSQSPFSLARTYCHSHLTRNGDFIRSPIIRHISKGEQVKDMILIRFQLRRQYNIFKVSNKFCI